MKQSTLFLSALLAPLAQAWQPPHIESMNLVWGDSFKGDAGSHINSEDWNIALHVNTNNEVQNYTESNRNIQISGGETLQLVPLRGENGEWTSGRVETVASYTPQPGKRMTFEANIRTGENANKQGIWPAVWLLGDAIRHGTEWPLCGEIDIYEQVNGVMEGHGTLHCGSFPDGVCNEPTGIAETVVIPNNDFHTWSVAIDRTSNDWQTESITWLLDGVPYHVLTGAGLGDEGTWATLAHSPMYMILNVAVGGNWPGDPNEATEDSWGSMLEIAYVAIYESA
ncbi:concanavalin A-like lectin/glucanase domain-containing protein [Stachybotrys elegans]|uniref:Concanavalin A-like lectin/glucanase domain-containing protein n=1 Tax=Stachybotrys elegans TaxID=80388 RepID=A0A8K0SPZ6_9HYPO|nr:concanavalin A-like lectin/glucanase domain-containing protein [Stachybotrys elegans]